MTESASYDIKDLTACVEGCRDAGLVGEPLADAIGRSETAVSRNRAEGMANRAAWHEAVVDWVDRLYSESEALGSAPMYEFEVRGS